MPIKDNKLQFEHTKFKLRHDGDSNADPRHGSKRLSFFDTPTTMPPRRSARLNSTPDTEAKVLLHTDSRLISRPSTSSMNPSTTRPTKRAKQQKDQESPKVDDYRRIRGRRGYLKLMTEMPVDILLEIFSRVEPLDLLQLSRATKALRGIITSPNVAFLWKTVRGTLCDLSKTNKTLKFDFPCYPCYRYTKISLRINDHPLARVIFLRCFIRIFFMDTTVMYVMTNQASLNCY